MPCPTTETRIAPQDHGGNLREIQALLGLPQVLDFSASINPLGQPEGLRERLAARWDEVARYPDRGCTEFLDAVSEEHRVPTQSLLAGNGSAELIDLLLRCLQPKRLLLAPPDFGLYRELVPPNLEVHSVPRQEESGFAPDVATLVEALRPGDLLILSNPCNPSGHYAHPGQLQPLLEACKQRQAHLVLDEAFADFQSSPTLLSLAAEWPQLTVLRSCTKFYGIPGLRLGFMVGTPERVRGVAALQVPWSVNCLAQDAGVYCLRHPDWAPRTRAAVQNLREELRRGLVALPGITPLDSAANYLLLRLDHPTLDANGLYEALARRGILVRHCGSFGLGERYLRVAVRTGEENAQLLTALGELLGSAPEGPAG